MRPMMRFFLIVMALSVFFSCTEGWIIDPAIKGERTILVYLAGDNDLSSEVAEREKAFMAAWDPSKMGRLLIFSDHNGKNSPYLLSLKKDCQGNILADTLKRYTNNNSASPELLKEVIEDMYSMADAKSYGFVVFSHASGWLPAGAINDPYFKSKTRSMIVDGKQEMAFTDFVAAIPDNSFEFIIFDMCFMAGVESSYSLRFKTKYILASAAELLSPGFTPTYRSSLDLLYKPEADLVGFARAFFDRVKALRPPYNSATVSLIKTDALTDLAKLVKGVYKDLLPSTIAGIQHYDRNGEPHLFFDLENYIRSMALKEQLSSLEKSLNQCVIFKRNTQSLINIPIRTHSGLSVYVPQPSLEELNRYYLQTEWSKAIR